MTELTYNGGNPPLGGNFLSLDQKKKKWGKIARLQVLYIPKRSPFTNGAHVTAANINFQQIKSLYFTNFRVICYFIFNEHPGL